MGKHGDPPVSQQLGDNARRTLWCTVVQRRVPGPTFLKLRPNAVNSTDQPLNHLFVKFAFYGLFSGTNSLMNDTFSIKNAVSIVLTRDSCGLVSVSEILCAQPR